MPNPRKKHKTTYCSNCKNYTPTQVVKHPEHGTQFNCQLCLKPKSVGR